MTAEPHVYFARHLESGLIKIGCSVNPAKRLAALAGNHELLAVDEHAGPLAEAELHERFDSLRTRLTVPRSIYWATGGLTEYFQPAPTLLAHIANLTGVAA